jgi:hypothetical protein
LFRSEGRGELARHGGRDALQFIKSRALRKRPGNDSPDAYSATDVQIDQSIDRTDGGDPK